jgi:ABC-2 type transport system ATP-binding protein
LVAQGSLTDIYRELGIQRTVHVQFLEPDNQLAGRIRQIDGVGRVDQYVDRFSISIREDLLSVADLHDRLHALGARIYMFQPEAMDMETVFMKLTEGKTA